MHSRPWGRAPQRLAARNRTHPWGAARAPHHGGDQRRTQRGTHQQRGGMRRTTHHVLPASRRPMPRGYFLYAIGPAARSDPRSLASLARSGESHSDARPRRRRQAAPPGASATLEGVGERTPQALRGRPPRPPRRRAPRARRRCGAEAARRLCARCAAVPAEWRAAAPVAPRKST